jgi:hypothetical protein
VRSERSHTHTCDVLLKATFASSWEEESLGKAKLKSIVTVEEGFLP